MRPPARFGHLAFDGDQIVEFDEKPQIGEGWINGAFFVLEPGVFDYIEGDDIMFEREPLSNLAKDGQLMAYRHYDFWQCMDTVRDRKRLEDLWSAEAPWKAWATDGRRSDGGARRRRRRRGRDDLADRGRLGRPGGRSCGASRCSATRCGPRPAEARGAPVGDIELCYSPVTGYLWNRAFDPALVAYSPAYENSLHHSPRFQDYVGALADRLVARYGLHGRQIVEIGPGEGNFLALLCERGHNWGLGYDAAYDPERSRWRPRPACASCATTTPSTAPSTASWSSASTCWSTWPSRPRWWRASAARSPTAPGRRCTSRCPTPPTWSSQLAVWDLIYEHVSYFAAPTLELLFRQAGFEVTEVDRAFGDQYLYLEAVPAAAGDGRRSPRSTPDAVAKLTELVASFGEHLRELVPRGRPGSATWSTRGRWPCGAPGRRA